MFLLAGTYLSTLRQTIPYRDKTTGEQTSFEKVEVFVLDGLGRPHSLSVGREFDESRLGSRGGPVFVMVRPSSFRNEVQLNIESVLSADEARAAIFGTSGLRSAPDTKTA